MQVLEVPKSKPIHFIWLFPDFIFSFNIIGCVAITVSPQDSSMMAGTNSTFKGMASKPNTLDCVKS